MAKTENRMFRNAIYAQIINSWRKSPNTFQLNRIDFPSVMKLSILIDPVIHSLTLLRPCIWLKLSLFLLICVTIRPARHVTHQGKLQGSHHLHCVNFAFTWKLTELLFLCIEWVITATRSWIDLKHLDQMQDKTTTTRQTKITKIMTPSAIELALHQQKIFLAF